MDLPSGNDIALYTRFLDRFCEEISDFTFEDDNLPIKILSYFLREEEIEGECLGWSQQYLLSNGCPAALSTHISCSAYLDLSKQDVSQFIADDDNDDVVEKDEDNNGVVLRKNGKCVCSDDNQDKITFLDIRKLLKEIIATVHKICQQWKKQLPPLNSNPTTHEVCVHAIKNTRRKMEDVHVICSDLNSLFNLKDCPSHSYYSVFDGHGGIEAALYASSHLHTNLVHQPNFLTDPAAALKQAYKQTDEGFLIRAKNENLKSGTTGISVLQQGSKLHIAWLGDSQAVLVKDGQTVDVMNPHKPDRADEKERIEKLGGIVVWFGTWRVNGAIAVARAIGDKSYKPYISSDADVFSADLDGSEDYIVLACDGVWDVIAPKDIPEIVYNHIQEHHGNRAHTAHRIVDLARENGSTDNISVIVVFLRDEIAVPQGNLHIDFFSNSAANNDSTGDRDQNTNNKKQSDENNESKPSQYDDQSNNQSDLKNVKTTILNIKSGDQNNHVEKLTDDICNQVGQSDGLLDSPVLCEINQSQKPKETLSSKNNQNKNDNMELSKNRSSKKKCLKVDINILK
ncbi:hypothetical protein SNE40_003026 [Patella caerulea]|uniref:Protein phosphatase 1E n=1 Tax=Patella caerulea TaxID=87958 RepID=A0AAN8Q0E9_PATCE